MAGLVCLSALLGSTIAAPQLRPDVMPDAQPAATSPPEQPGSPFAPMNGVPETTPSPHVRGALAEYRVAGIAFSATRNVAVLQLPDQSFQIVEPGTVFSSMTVLRISSREVVMQTPQGAYRLRVSE